MGRKTKSNFPMEGRVQISSSKRKTRQKKAFQKSVKRVCFVAASQKERFWFRKQILKPPSPLPILVSTAITSSEIVPTPSVYKIHAKFILGARNRFFVSLLSIFFFQKSNASIKRERVVVFDWTGIIRLWFYWSRVKECRWCVRI